MRPSRADTSGTEVFEAASVDLALRAARDAHGPDVQVVRALRVVSGVRGLLGQARYQVLVRPPVPVEVTVLPTEPVAAPPPAAAASAAEGGDPLRSALDDLLDAAEARERGGPPDIVEEDSGWSWAQQQEVDRLLADLDARVGAGASPHPALEMAAHETAPPPAPLPADEQQDDDEWAEVEDSPGSGWDRDELRRLGVPAAVLSHLPVEDPSDDAGWRRALQNAIAAVVPPPAKADAQHPVVLSGHGLLGVVALLRGAVEEGLTPGTISFDGRRRPANPAALVDVLAAVVRS